MSTEEIINPAAQTKGRARQEVSVIIQDELQIAGVTEESFKALKEEAAALATLEPKTDAEVATIQKVITKGNNLKSTISDAIEPGKKWAHALHKAYTSNENEFIGTVDAIIEPLKAKKAAYKAEQERLEREENEAREARIRERLVAIEGFEFVRRTGSQGEEDYYMNAGGTRLPITQVTMSGDEEWGNIIKGIEIAWNEERERKEAVERAEQEERNRIQAQREEFERKEREMKEREDAFNAKINEARKNELLALGFGMSDDGTHVECLVPLPPPRTKKASYEIASLHKLGDALWQEELSVAKLVIDERYAALERISEAEARRKEQEAREALIAERVKALKDAGWEGDGFALWKMSLTLSTGPLPPRTTSVSVDELSHEQFLECVEDGQAELARRKKVEQDRIAAEAVEAERKRQEQEATRKAAEEQERKAKLSDVERWDAWMVAIEENAPNLVSAQGQHAVRHLLAYIKDKYAPSVRNELKK